MITPRSKILFSYGDVPIPGGGMSNFGVCSALTAFEQGGIFIVPRGLGFVALSEGSPPPSPPHLVALYEKQELISVRVDTVGLLGILKLTLMLLFWDYRVYHVKTTY